MLSVVRAPWYAPCGMRPVVCSLSCALFVGVLTQTVLRLGATARIASWVDIYMLSALVKVGQVRRALYRYQLLVGPLKAYQRRATHIPGGWTEGMAALHSSSGWLWDPLSNRAMRLNMHTAAVESHDSLFEAALAHARAFRVLRNTLPPPSPPAGDARQLSAEEKHIQHTPLQHTPLHTQKLDAQEHVMDADEEWVRDADEEWVQDTLGVLQEAAQGCDTVRALVVELGRRDGRTGKIGKDARLVWLPSSVKLCFLLVWCLWVCNAVVSVALVSVALVLCSLLVSQSSLCNAKSNNFLASPACIYPSLVRTNWEERKCEGGVWWRWFLLLWCV